MPDFSRLVAETGGLVLPQSSASIADFLEEADEIADLREPPAVMANPNSAAASLIASVCSTPSQHEYPTAYLSSGQIDHLTAFTVAFREHVAELLPAQGVMGASPIACIDPRSVSTPNLIGHKGFPLGEIAPSLYSVSGSTLWAQFPTAPAVTSQLLEAREPALQGRLQRIRTQCEAWLLAYMLNVRRDVANAFRTRLAELFDPENWEESDLLPSLASFQNLIAYFSKNPDLRTPSLTISDGDFAATWLRGRHDLVRLQFDGAATVKWLVLLPPVGSKHHPKQGTGWIPMHEARALLEVYGVMDLLVSPAKP